MAVKSMITDNKFLGSNLEKMYLNIETADVIFKFETAGITECIPAHRSLLAAGSPILEKILYDRFKDMKIIKAEDSSSTESFKVFLQFFYLNEVNITLDNFAEVALICKKFGVYECFKKCLEIAKIASNNICFLNCNKFTFGKVLELVKSCAEFDALEIVEASMNWARAECKKAELDETDINLRNRFGDLIRRIPFQELTIQQFSKFARKHKKLFTSSDLRRIIYKISTNVTPAYLAERKAKSLTTNAPENHEKLSTPKENNSLQKDVEEAGNLVHPKRSYYCFRRITNSQKRTSRSVTKFRDVFTTNYRILLTDIYFLNCLAVHFDVYFKMINFDTKEFLTSGKITCHSIVTLEKPIIIEPGTKYSIIAECKSTEAYTDTCPDVVMRCILSDIVITFEKRLRVLVAGFKFQKA